MRQVLSIWLPNLAVERWAKASDCAPDAPVVLTVEGPHGPIIHAVTKAAAGRGARTGARLTDARALDPALVAVAADPEGDAALLQRLARWAGRWSPLVEVDGPDGLRLDVTGVAHLFGGEEGLARDVRARFAALGLTSRIAIAPAAAAAWALSHFSPESSSIVAAAQAASSFYSRGDAETRRCRAKPQRLCVSASPREIDLSSRFRGNDELAQTVAPLHVSALRLDGDTVRTLDRLGLKTIGALMEVPRLALARRFRGAESVVDALDRMLGRKPETLTAVAADRPPRAALRLEEPATHPEAAAQALGRLIPMLVRDLQERHLGARRLSLTGFRVDGSIATASVATTIPSRDPKHLLRLLVDKTASLDPEFGFDAFALQADWCESLGAAQESLVEEPSGERDLARLVDRLTVKLGPQRVQRPQRCESYLPERASGWVAAIFFPSPSREGCRGGVRLKPLDAAEGAAERASSPLVRHPPPAPSLEREGRKGPQRLLDRPEAIDVIYATPEGMPRRFVWRRAVHDIARAEGPERIAPEWWRQPSSARLRDYYRVEDADGRRYWIYRESVIGDGRGGAPAWFVHGMFG
ncbi:MAG TPA: DNA polymerase Y family protein [Sphingomicrobium sp.]|nr:DNA polymerase Y family protein [Sphingomicrobium sp.]